jgi:hypothetical protein
MMTNLNASSVNKSPRLCRNRVVLALLLTAFINLDLKAEMVEAEGKAAGDGQSARAEALTDALREAVRSGAGIDLVSESKVTNFALDYDRIFSKASGYVKHYDVLSSGAGADGIYRVKIKAEVGKGTAEMTDMMTLQMLARLKQTPRVVIKVEEKIGGATASDLAADWLRNIAREVGLQVVQLEATQGVSNAMAKRASILGRDQESAVRSQGIMDLCDYVIEGTVVGDYGGAQSLYGSTPRHRFSLAVNLRVVDAATGSLVIVENPPNTEILVPRASSVDVAAREAVRKMMEGDNPSSKTDSGWKMFRRLFAHWTTEMDLGSTVRLDISGASLDLVNQIRDGLAEETQIGSVWIRSVDPATISVVDIESRLPTPDLAERLVKIGSGKFQLDRTAARYISIIPAKVVPSADRASVEPQLNQSSSQANPSIVQPSLPGEVRIDLSTLIIGFGSVILVSIFIAVAVVLKRSKK